MDQNRWMQRATITWLVMTRELGDAVRVTGEGPLVVSLILDTDTGLIRGVQADTDSHAALTGAMRTALTQPAANLPAGAPARVLCQVGASTQVRGALDAVGATAVPVEEVHPGAEAEDIVDSLVGHLAGRTQPTEAPTSSDWQLLMTQALAFARAEPWSRWSDEQELLLTLSTDRGSAPYLAIVLGQAGVQHGLALYPGHDLPAALDRGEPAESVVLLLEPTADLPPEITAKARRYAWPERERLTPAYMSLTPDGPGEISRDDAHLLTAALSAVRALDQRGLHRPGDAVTGEIRLADNDTVAYDIAHRVTPPSRTSRLQMHVARHDLVTPETAVTLGHITWDVLPQLQADALVHRPAPADAPARAGSEVALLVLSPPSAAGPALAAALAELDPYGASAIDLRGGQHAIVITGSNGAEQTITLPNQHPALLAWNRRQRETRGRHLIMVADLDSNTDDGSIYALFECHQPVAARPPAKKRPSNNKKKRR